MWCASGSRPGELATDTLAPPSTPVTEAVRSSSQLMQNIHIMESGMPTSASPPCLCATGVPGGCDFLIVRVSIATSSFCRCRHM